MRFVDADALVEELGLSCHGCHDNCIKKSCQIPEIIKRIENLLLSTDKEPNLFSCPVRPRQIVYEIHSDAATGCPFIVKEMILSVTFMPDGDWYADVVGLEPFDHFLWMETVFPTREEAEAALKRMEENDDKID